jgi:hypothetical protein
MAAWGAIWPPLRTTGLENRTNDLVRTKAELIKRGRKTILLRKKLIHCFSRKTNKYNCGCLFVSQFAVCRVLQYINVHVSNKYGKVRQNYKNYISFWSRRFKSKMKSDMLMCFVISLLRIFSLCSCDNTGDVNDKFALLKKPDYKLSTVSAVLT